MELCWEAKGWWPSAWGSADKCLAGQSSRATRGGLCCPRWSRNNSHWHFPVAPCWDTQKPAGYLQIPPGFWRKSWRTALKCEGWDDGGASCGCSWSFCTLGVGLGSCTQCMHFVGGTSEMSGDGRVGSLSTKVSLSLSHKTALQDLSSGVCARIPKFTCVLLLHGFLFPFAATFCFFLFSFLCAGLGLWSPNIPWSQKLVPCHL